MNKAILELIELYKQYKKDPKVIYDLNPIGGVIFSFEGFWIWLLEKFPLHLKESEKV